MRLRQSVSEIYAICNIRVPNPWFLPNRGKHVDTDEKNHNDKGLR
jgi:hypothetical protein